MSKNISIDPITRIEGHLAIRVQIESNVIKEAYCSGEMFRGFEVILRGRDPMDAQQITQRICGVCPISHGMASITAQDMAYGIHLPKNGRLIRNLILGANYIQSHIIHFYHLSALDFVDITAILKYTGKDKNLQDLKSWVKAQISSNQLYPAAPFLPRYDSKYIENTEINIAAIKNYLDALEMRGFAQQAGALFGGKLPHAATLIPGGVTEKVTAKKIAEYTSIMKKLSTFIDEAYIPDVIEVANAFPDYFNIGKGCENFLAYGVFPESDDTGEKFFPDGIVIKGKLNRFDPSMISEDVLYSNYSSASGLTPGNGETLPDPHKQSAYSWLKAPRYDNMPMEVGPLARVLVAYLSNSNNDLNKLVDGVLGKLYKRVSSLFSVLGRHAARAIETKLVAQQCLKWINELNPDAPVFQDFEIPDSCKGYGLTEAPRGALGHWINVKDKKIHNYQCVVPTTWNCSPKDDRGIPGPVEQALIGAPVVDEHNPMEPARIVRSFDPCIACAVH